MLVTCVLYVRDLEESISVGNCLPYAIPEKFKAGSERVSLPKSVSFLPRLCDLLSMNCRVNGIQTFTLYQIK